MTNFSHQYNQPFWYPASRLYRAQNSGLYVVGRMLKASWGRRGKQQQEQNSPNHVPTIISPSVHWILLTWEGGFDITHTIQYNTTCKTSHAWNKFLGCLPNIYCMNGARIEDSQRILYSFQGPPNSFRRRRRGKRAFQPTFRTREQEGAEYRYTCRALQKASPRLRESPMVGRIHITLGNNLAWLCISWDSKSYQMSRKV